MKLLIIVGLLLASVLALGADYERFEENGKVGLKDATGKVVLPASFDALGWSDGNFFVIGQITGYRQQNKWGLINLKKEFITQALYESISSNGSDRVVVSKWITPFARKFGCIDLSGKLVIPFSYDDIQLVGLRGIVMLKTGAQYAYGLIDLNDKSILPVRYRQITPIGSLRYAVKNTDGKIALCNEAGQWTTEFILDSISTFRHDLAIIYQDWKQGVIHRSGDIKLPAAYREIKINDAGNVSARKVDAWKIVDAQGKDVAQTEADNLHLSGNDLGRITLGGKVGLITNELQQQWPIAYDYISKPSNGKVVVKKNDKMGVFRLDKTEVIQPVFDSIAMEGNFIRTMNKTGSTERWELYDTFGIKKTISSYDFIDDFNGRFLPVRNKEYVGAVDRYGRERIACVYDSLLQIKNDLLVVKFKGQYGIINMDDQWQVPPQRNKMKIISDYRFVEQVDSMLFMKDFSGNALYFTDNTVEVQTDQLLETLPDGTQKEINFLGQITERKAPVALPSEQAFRESEGLTGIRRDGKFGFVDARGRLRIANRYDSIGEFHHDLAPVKILGKWGFINTSDQIVIQPTFDRVENFIHGIAIVARKGKAGLIDPSGKVRLDMRYDAVTRLSDRLFGIALGAQHGLADEQGTVLIEPRFEKLEIIPGDRVIVTQNGRYGILTTDGLSIFPIHYDQLTYLPEKNSFLARVKSDWVEIEIK